MIKDKIPSKTKFYVLVFLKELLQSNDNLLVSLFDKYLLSRLVEIGTYKIKNETLSRETKSKECLNQYYDN